MNFWARAAEQKSNAPNVSHNVIRRRSFIELRVELGIELALSKRRTEGEIDECALGAVTDVETEYDTTHALTADAETVAIL